MKRFRPLLVVLILLLTVAVFIWYFANHPEVRHQLGHTSPGLLAALLGLYGLGVFALALIMLATLRLCRLGLTTREGFLLTAYSSVINFFGPLQSGPAFRAVYLRKKYDLNLKRYGLATLIYYFFYAGFSGLFLLSGVLGWWLLPLAVLGLLSGITLLKAPRLKHRFAQLDLHGWYYLAAATFLQVAIVGVIYYLELRSVAPGTGFSQAVIYTGAANLSLFVSITPGAIGFREAFLLFSQHLHHVSNDAIVAASILDRTMYIILMALLAIFIFGSHASRRLQTVQVTKGEEA